MIRFRFIAAALALTGLLSCSSKINPDPTPTPGPEPETYKYQYPLSCTIDAPVMSKAADDFDALWSSSDAPVLMSGGNKVGRLTLQSGEGKNTALFLVETDLEEGTTATVSVLKGGIATAESEPVMLRTRMQDCILKFQEALVSLTMCAVEGTTYDGASVTSVSVGDSERVLEKFSLSKDLNSLWIAVKPCDLESIPLTIKTSAGNVSTSLSGRNLVAGKIYRVKVNPLGSSPVTPADKSLPEFTYKTVEYKANVETAAYSKFTTNLEVSGMNWMPKLNVMTHDRWGGYEGVKPDEIISTNTAGYWHTGKYKGRWVMVDPDGNVAIIHGVNTVTPEAGNRLKDQYNKNFSSTAEWATFANRVITDYGFNFVSCNPQRIRNLRTIIPAQDEEILKHGTPGHEVSEVGIVFMLRTFSWDYYSLYSVSPDTDEGSVFALMFDPKYLDYIDALAKDAAALYKNDKNFIGYYTDNELQFRFSSSSTPAIYLKQWLALPTGTGKPLAFQYAKAYAENFMRDNYGVEPVAANVTTAMDNAFLLAVSEYYYKTVTEALRKYDPDHLILGSRLHGKPKTLQQVHEACAKYCDVLSINLYNSWEPNDGYFISQFKPWIKADKPCFITEFYSRDVTATFNGEAYANTGEGGGWIVKSQTARGQHYQNFTRKAISYDHCIGWQWFKFDDDDLTGYGWNNKGIVSPDYEPYHELVTQMRTLNWNIYQIMDYYFNKSGMKTSVGSDVQTACWEY